MSIINDIYPLNAQNVEFNRFDVEFYIFMVYEPQMKSDFTAF